jgi:hypothetical protein
VDLDEKLHQGITAAQAGRKGEARTLLTEVVEADETQLEAWFWLSQIVDSLEEKSICLENILTLDPNNDSAQAELIRVKAAQERLFAPVYAPGQENPPPAVVTLPKAAKTPIVDLSPYKDEFDNPGLCPYCLAPTRLEDQHCPACKRSLVIRRRDREERTAWLWRGIILQFTVILALVAGGLSSYIIMIRLAGLREPTAFLPLYFGQRVSQPELSETVLAVFPAWLFWSLIGAVFYALILLIALYLRLPYGNILYLVTATLVLVLSFLSLIFYYDVTPTLILGLIGLFLGAAQLFITLNLWQDFTFKEHRIQLKIDRDAKNHMTLFLSSRKYSQAGMWGLATLHLRRAVAGNPQNASYQLALVVAYINVKRDDLAEKALAQAEKLDPHAPEIGQLRKQLNSRV